MRQIGTKMSEDQRRSILNRLTLVLVILAFANSYRHGVTWAQAHSPAGDHRAWVYMIAALPEILVIMVVLSFPETRWGIKTLIPGSLAIGWTLYANGSAAAPGASGLFIAVSPAVVSLIGLWLTHAPAQPVRVAQPVSEQPEPTQDHEPEPMPEPEPVSEPEPLTEPEPVIPAGLSLVPPAQSDSDDSDETEPDQATGTDSGTIQDRGVVWARAQKVVPSRQEIQDHLGCSRATANRVRAAALSASGESGR
jgi:hypothetical protein